MWLTIALFSILLTAYSLMLIKPTAARALVAHLKRSWRLYIIRREGERAANRLFRRLRREASLKGIDEELVEHFIDMKKEQISWRLGVREANARLGQPTPLERYH